MNKQLNSNHVNAKIKAAVLSEGEMSKAGFTDCNEHVWYFFKQINFPKKYKSFDVSFNVSIPKNGSDISIDVLDEDFGQPYDYQQILKNNSNHALALIVSEQVEEWTKYLHEAGVLSGHVEGEYI